MKSEIVGLGGGGVIYGSRDSGGGGGMRPLGRVN